MTKVTPPGFSTAPRVALPRLGSGFSKTSATASSMSAKNVCLEKPRAADAIERMTAPAVCAGATRETQAEK